MAKTIELTLAPLDASDIILGDAVSRTIVVTISKVGATGAAGPAGPPGADGVGGSSNLSVSTKVANYTITTADDIIVGDATGGAIVITLPTAIGATKEYSVKRINSGSNLVTVGTTLGQAIDGSPSAALTVPYQTLTFFSNNANWFIK